MTLKANLNTWAELEDITKDLSSKEQKFIDPYYAYYEPGTFDGGGAARKPIHSFEFNDKDRYSINTKFTNQTQMNIEF